MNIIPDNAEYKDETWREYVDHYIIDDDGYSWEDELRKEEEALYENGYITFSELYFGHTIESDEI